MNSLVRRSAFPMISAVSTFNDLIDEFFNSPSAIIGKEKSSYPMNITKIEKNGEFSAYRIEYALAGFKKDEIKITVVDDVLKIEAEHKSKVTDADDSEVAVYNGISYRTLSTSYKLMDNVDQENITSKYEDGLLEIIVPAKSKIDDKKCINIDIK